MNKSTHSDIFASFVAHMLMHLQKLGEVSFFPYLRFDIWFSEDGKYRSQAAKRAEAEAMWKSFLVSVHQLAVPTDQTKYNLTAEQIEALKKQKNDRGKRKNKSRTSKTTMTTSKPIRPAKGKRQSTRRSRGYTLD